MALDVGLVGSEALAGPREPVPARASSTRQRSLTYVSYVVLQLLQLVLLLRAAPRLFWYDDAQAQFGPMLWWLGRHLEDGRPPLLDPDQGVGGNLTADMQYGVLDPLHWVVQALAGTTDDLLVLSWAYGGACLLLLGTGALAVLLHHRVLPVLAVAGALGIASSGFLVWYGSSWWPLLWSVAWVPWLWLGMATRGWPGAALAGVATWALLTAGNPYAVPFALLLVLAQLWERYREAGSLREMLDAPLLGRLVACVGGAGIALPTVLTVLELAPMLGRLAYDPLVGNGAFGVTNAADVVLGGTTLLGQTNAWKGSIGLAPAMASMVVALPLLALVSWADAWRAKGVPTAAAVLAAAVTATQLPSVVLVFRYPLRHLALVQVFLALLALIAVTAAPRLTPTRLRVAAGLVLLQGLLAAFRAPLLLPWHVLAVGLAGLSLVAAVVLVRQARWTAAAAVVLLLGTSAGPLVGEQMMEAVAERRNLLAGSPAEADQPLRPLLEGYDLGTTVQSYRERAYAVDTSLTTIFYGGFPPDRGWQQGVVDGNGNLLAGLRPGFGSLASWQTRLQPHWCHDYQGASCSDPSALLAPVPGTDRPWVDVLSTDTVVLHEGAPEALRQHFDTTWRRAVVRGPWTEYQRDDGLPGRVTVAQGVEVSSEGWTAGLAYAGRPHDRYVVSTGSSGGSLLLRIPYFSGFRATLDGRPLPVSSADKAVLRIDLPAGVSSGALAVSYAPTGVRIAEVAWLAGALLVALGAVVAARPRLAGRRTAGDGQGAGR